MPRVPYSALTVQSHSSLSPAPRGDRSIKQARTPDPVAGQNTLQRHTTLSQWEACSVTADVVIGSERNPDEFLAPVWCQHLTGVAAVDTCSLSNFLERKYALLMTFVEFTVLWHEMNGCEEFWLKERGHRNCIHSRIIRKEKRTISQDTFSMPWYKKSSTAFNLIMTNLHSHANLSQKVSSRSTTKAIIYSQSL